MNMDHDTRTREKSEFSYGWIWSIWGQFEVKFSQFCWKIADFLSKMDKDFIDFHWFLMNLLSKIADFLWILSKGLLRNWSGISLIFIEFSMILLSNFIQNCFWKWEKYFIQFSRFYYQIFIDLTLLQHFYFCITFWLILIGFHLKIGLNSISFQFVAIWL